MLPETGDTAGITELLRAITASGLASFLAVIKVFGSVKSPGMLSFPRPGITLALDFPVGREASFVLLNRLAAITVEYGGRMYPAKDALMTAPQFQTFYPNGKNSRSLSIPRSTPPSGNGSPRMSRQMPRRILILGGTSAIAVAVARELLRPMPSSFS